MALLRDSTTFYINGEKAESVKELKYLGVTLSDKLTWTSNNSGLVKSPIETVFLEKAETSSAASEIAAEAPSRASSQPA